MAALHAHLGQHGIENPRMGKSHETLPQDHFKLQKHLCGWWLWADVDLVRGRMSGSVAQSPPLSLPWDCPVGTSGVATGLGAGCCEWRARASEREPGGVMDDDSDSGHNTAPSIIKSILPSHHPPKSPSPSSPPPPPPPATLEHADRPTAPRFPRHRPNPFPTNP
jgi:hypothetical protein